MIYCQTFEDFGVPLSQMLNVIVLPPIVQYNCAPPPIGQYNCAPSPIFQYDL